MKNRALLSAVALCFLVAGCESKKEEPVKPKVADKVVPLPAPAPTPPPASGGQDAKPAGQATQVAQLAATTKATAPAPLKGCKRGNCKIKVTVDVSSAGVCKILKDPDIRGVWKGPQGGAPERDVPIEWAIMTADWQFDAKGIDFHGNNKFKNGSAGNGNRTYTWTDVNDDAGKHDYWVNLVNPRTNKKCNADPSIVNGVLVED
jgi:hypothetical protein